MSASNAEVVKRFFSGATKLHGNTLYISENHLYHRYGFRTLIAKRLAPDFFLINGDNTASGWGGGRYNTQLSRLAPKSPVISFSALEQAVDIEGLRVEDFLEMRAGYSGELFSKDEGKTWFDWSNVEHWPQPGQFIEQSKQDWLWNKETGIKDIPCLTANVHILGGSLFKSGPDYFLSAMDEGSYFISQLPGPCNTIDEAFEMLKPDEVREAEMLGIEVQRQGEWFFKKISDEKSEELSGLKPKTLLRDMRRHGLPIRNPRSNIHVVKLYRVKGNVLCTGKVHHYRGPRTWGQRGIGIVPTQSIGHVEAPPLRDVPVYQNDEHWYQAMTQEDLDWPLTHKSHLSGEHRTLNLEGFWLAYRNTELASYTSTVKGGVD